MAEHEGLHPLREDGKWIRTGNGQHHYITNPDHVHRMLQEGGQLVEDPRKPEIRQVHVQAGDIKVEVEEEAPEKHGSHRRMERGR